MFGVDYVSGPTPAQLKAAGVTFVCRYLSYVNNLTQVKILTANEAKALSAANISIVSNYEWYANRATEGHASGVQDAQIAAQQHAACGGPSNRPIYFSVDVDVDGSAVAAYFQGVASVLGLARTGAYGSYRVLQYLFNAHLITFGWQTYAWSYGAWEPRAHLQQYQNGVSLSGHSVDYNRSTTSDFGQWKIGGNSMIPQGWTDENGVLISPASVQGGEPQHITGAFREYILSNPWPSANVAITSGVHVEKLEMSSAPDGPCFGSGWQQEFRFAMLAKPDTGPKAGQVIYEWNGVELRWCREEIAKLQAQLAAVHDLQAVANRLTALAQLGHQIEDVANQPL